MQVKVQPDGRLLREEPILFDRWLVFTSDRVGVGVVSGVISAKESVKIGVRRIRTFPFFSDSAYDSIAYDLVKTKLSESEAEAEG